MKPVKVIVVDDSLFMRELVHKELEKDINIKVVAKAADPFEASRQIVQFHPDVLLVDVFMDRMNGIDFIQQLLPQYFLPVIMMSSEPKMRESAEQIKTVTFFDKPKETDAKGTELFFNLIRAKIRAIINQEDFNQDKVAIASNKLIAIGASTGGAEAIETVIKNLPSAMPPLVIAQHMPPKFTTSFTERLNSLCRLSVKEAVNGDMLIAGHVYIAPGGYHMTLTSAGGKYGVSCVENTTGSPICPSVDILFDSVGHYAGNSNTLGILLTGMGKDGAKGLKMMYEQGCHTIGQDEQSSIVYGMPKAAFDLGAVEKQLPLQMISAAISDFVWK